ncbi:stalk domain-containing protein [Bacillus methanolicus]|uniref:Copper amine oxidase-like N-terminal domain-containing protein n=1 Tax=Bacillus methanolicus (strain MGA3 / ATCC 53907) TaxID=796606 RepID=I3DYY9_BACMM|nr:stalk domain-containing protein [Bacillus methanolicus]AIE59535.1 hypothetical protein BMMGA3_05535 [Bacillus methanolicus MGA3]EIJ79460.1 hypothetical protein MGA3_13931 [Bacillus methanolicus MGA3]
MFRTSFFIFMILSAAIGGMLFWQWKAYTEKHEATGRLQTEPVHQQITLESVANELKISQTITGLIDGKEYRVSIPKNVSTWKCLKADGTPCISKDQLHDTFKAEDGKIVFSYSISFNNHLSSLFFNEWTISLRDVSTYSTKLEIIDYARRGGSWAAGLPLKGYKQLDFIDYFVFEGKRKNFSLYWQKKPLYQATNLSQINFFVESKESEPVNLSSLKFVSDFPYLTVVLTDSYPETDGNGIIVVKKNIKQDILVRKVFDYYFRAKFSKSEIEEKWLADVLAAYFTKQKSRSTKGEKIIQELTTKLSDQELKEFMSSVILEKSALSAKVLDEQLSKQKGLKTQFFTLNKNETASFVPLSFFDSRKVYINGEEKKGIEILYQNKKRLFPLIEVLNGLGYEVKYRTGEKTLLLNKGNNRYRFYTNRNIFVFNKEDYGLLENPFLLINGKIYIEEKWLRPLFKINIKENDFQIDIFSF